MEDALHLLKSISDKQNMSYIISSKEGGIFLIDGGYRDDVNYLLDYLRDINHNNKIHIDAIWLTHPHIDHIEAFLSLIKEHQDEFDFDYLYYYFPTFEEVKDDKDSRLIKEFNELLPLFVNKAVQVKEGDIIKSKGVIFEVLYTFKEKQINVNAMNNSSLVFKVIINHKDILFTGDIGVEAGDYILKALPNKALEADYCQMAHHGQGGPSKSFYEAVRPRLGCFWNSPSWLYDNDLGNGYNSGPYKTIIVRNWMKDISPNHVDYCNKDETIKILL